MKETEVGYRVSKSSESITIRIDKGVKEQRVDGNWCFYLSNPLPSRAMRKHLRYTLMGGETSYQVEVLSNQFKKRFCSFALRGSLAQGKASTLSLAQGQDGNVTLNPYFITGRLRQQMRKEVLL